MKKTIFAFLLVFAAFLHAAPQKVERFLLVAGANNGGSDRVKLRYAESDANSFANVMSQMGGIDQNNILRVFDANAASLKNGFAEMEKRLQSKSSETRKEVLVYYSGHADEQGLRLGRDIYSWEDFRQSVHNLNANVKVAVLDACGSGAITRTKGGVSRPAFMQDASSEMKGYAFLTSSNGDEVSQESDRIKGSFFTHSLVTGLRGAADMTGDGKVTLNEAYQFAFNETLQSTQNTSGGVQHPSRDMNLAGTGDVVMTDLRQVSASLVLEKDLEGRFFIRDEKGNLIAELYKITGRPLELGLPAGKYSVQMEAPSRLWKATDITLADGKKQVLSMNNMKSIDRQEAVARGDADSALVDGLDSARKATFSTDFNLLASNNEPANGMWLGIFATNSKKAFVGTQLALFVNFAQDDVAGVQISPLLNFGLGKTYGSQIGALNFTNYIEGVQASFWMNVAMNFKGVQAGPVNIAAEGYGVQAGPVNIARNLNGFQGGPINIAQTSKMGQGGVLNLAKDAGYGQGGVMNIGGKMEYAQGGVLNVAGNAGKVQGGVINVAGSVGTLQGGIINVGGHVGRQIGMINVSAKSDKTPIGLINIVGNGIIDVTLYADETSRGGATLHMGTPYLYTLVEYTSKDWGDYWPKVWGFGLGTRFGMWGNFFNLDYSFSNVSNKEKGTFSVGGGEDNFLHKIRAGGAYKLLPGLALSSGITFNMLSEGYGDALYLEPSGEYHFHKTFGGTKVRMWPGLYAGFTVGKF